MHRMGKSVVMKTVVAMMLECHGSSINFLQLQLKLESAVTNHLLIKVLQLNSYNSNTSMFIVLCTLTYFLQVINLHLYN